VSVYAAGYREKFSDFLSSNLRISGAVRYFGHIRMQSDVVNIFDESIRTLFSFVTSKEFKVSK